jgi:amino acid transporter
MASVQNAAHKRDSGLVRSIGPLALSGAFLGILVGSGVFNVPAPMAAAVGSYASLAYVACAIAVGAVMLCIAEGVSRVPTSAGIGGYVDAAFGPYWGFVVAVSTWASVVLSAGGIAAAAADIIATAAPSMASGPVRAIVITGWFMLLAVLNMRGAGFAAGLVATATSIKLVPLALFVAVGIWFIDPAKLALPMAEGSTDIGRAALLGIFLFLGIEGGLGISGEVKDASRNIPRAIIGALVVYALLCVLIQLVAQGLLGDALAKSTAPLPEAMAGISPPLGLLLGAGGVISMLGWTASDALSSPRFLFAMSRDGFLPSIVGRLHPRGRTPYVASLIHASIASGLAVSGSFAALAILATLFSVLLFIIAAAAAVKLRKENVALAGTPVRIPGLYAFAVLGIAAMLWLGAQSSREEAIGIAISLAVISLVYRFRRR